MKILTRGHGRTLGVASLLLAGSALMPATAWAQAATEEQAEAEPANADIVVTAQRRSERLQDVPIAISALGSEGLESRGIASAEDLQGAIPGLSITGFAGVNSTNLVSLRGIAGQPVPIGASQATAVYLDGVFLAKPDAAFFALEDVERVEVLRGPQGTLYGRNATAGAINIITREPSQQLEGKLAASYGNYNSIDLGGYVAGPLGGNFSGSLSGSYSSRDGYYRNTVTNNRIGKTDSYTGRARVKYENGGFDATLSGDYTSRYSQDIFTPATLVSGQVLFNTKTVSTNIEDQIGTRLKTGGVSLTMNFEAANNFTVTSVSSYRTFDFFTIYDIDATTATSIQPIFTNKIDTFSQEVRGVYTGERLRFTIGANYYQEEGDVMLRVNPVAYTEAQLRLDPRPHAQNHLTALAGFGQFEFDITDTLTVVAGARVNYETRDFSIDYSTAGTPGQYPPIIGNVNDTAFLPSAGLNFQPDSNLLFYVKASRGYQSPGFAYQPGAGGALNTFGAEKLWAYEGGAKMQFADRRITLNTAAFRYDYAGIQLRRLISPLISRIENVGSAKVTGIEGELIVVPVNGLTLSAQATYSEGVYTNFCEGITTGTPQNNDPQCVGTPAPTADRAGNALNQAPRWSGGASINYKTPIGGDNKLNFNLSYSWESNSYFTAANEAQVSTGGWHKLDARAGIELANGLEAYVFGHNITGDRHIVMAFRFGGAVSAVVSDPATYGVGLKFGF
ncbi:TonB-dependent receptor [Sphingomonas sp. AOB5]|uniref:TonB-dependent receptor n=1 Tax=Sphingomonas sp. AOB5 TaxID=3034017 RepID=UPI0023FA0E21|nr:TonB-dependent receptor [Sphingomonas sp. AOB5]MDF7775359.1 TonB-dependent receptor [Sphingomonas sp. AOB5]